jgi:hypothetical protein
MKKLLTILLLFLTLSTPVYASLDSEWQVNKITYGWQEFRLELERKYPMFYYEFLEESKSNLYFIRKNDTKNYLQNINKKSGNIYQYDFNTNNWRYQGSLSVTDTVYSN